MRSFLAWKPIEATKHTLLATTGYIEKVLYLSLQLHYRSRFQLLNVNRLDEVYAADTLLSNVESHDSYTHAQIYCGKKYSFTHVFVMKIESDMPGTFMYFIRTFYAMKGLFYYNAKFQTGAVVKDILWQYNIDDMNSDPPQ